MLFATGSEGFRYAGGSVQSPDAVSRWLGMQANRASLYNGNLCSTARRSANMVVGTSCLVLLERE